MGKVVNRIKLSNSTDLGKADAKEIDPSAVRTMTIEGIVDTGATSLAIPEDVARALGLEFKGTRSVKMANGERHALHWVRAVGVEILGREMTCDAYVLPAGVPALIGQIPLEALDLIVDPKSRELRVNPESPDAPLLDLYGFTAHA
jgi:clan AA aspartic protease